MQKKSIYKYASEAGVPVGLYLTLMSACILLSVKVPALPILIVPLALGFPFLLWAVVKKIGREEPSYMKFSSLWLGGIYSVIFGTLICMFFSSFYLELFEPNFVNLYITNALEAVESTPAAVDYEASIRLMHEAINAHLLPTGLEFLSSIAWFTCFAGSILSLIISLIMTRKTSRVTDRQPI